MDRVINDSLLQKAGDISILYSLAELLYMQADNVLEIEYSGDVNVISNVKTNSVKRES